MAAASAHGEQTLSDTEYWKIQNGNVTRRIVI